MKRKPSTITVLDRAERDALDNLRPVSKQRIHVKPHDRVRYARTPQMRKNLLIDDFANRWTRAIAGDYTIHDKKHVQRLISLLNGKH